MKSWTAQMQLMQLRIFILYCFTTLPSLANGLCSQSGSRKNDLSSCQRYEECFNGQWKSMTCPENHSFQQSTATCVWDPNCHSTTSVIPSNSMNKEPKRVSRRQIAVRGYETSKQKWSSGQVISTTIRYYNSQGRSYTFTMPGEPPVPTNDRDAMLDWIERNSYKYETVDIAFKSPPNGLQPTGSYGIMGPAQPNYPPQTYPGNQLNPIGGNLPPQAQPSGTGSFSPNKPQVTPSPQVTPAPSQNPSPNLLSTSSADKYLISDCGKVPIVDKIIGGVEIPIEVAPWQVAIIDKSDKTISCGGSIITKYHVVTAAHCFQRWSALRNDIFIKKENRLIRAGSNDLKVLVAEYEIAELYIHDKYNSTTKKSDIALIKIQGSFNFGANIFPICLPDIQEDYFKGRRCVISGWGKTENQKSVQKLRMASVEITAKHECEAENALPRNLTIMRMVCAGNYETGGNDTCSGDSGGALACPLNQKYRLCGITSWGIGCGEKKMPGVYTRVASFISWIRKRIEVSMDLSDKAGIPSMYDYDDTIIADKTTTSEYDDYDDQDI